TEESRSENKDTARTLVGRRGDLLGMTPCKSFHTDSESPSMIGIAFGMAESHALIRFHFHALQEA
ncbi:MAG: hypothetical protein KGM47_17200, partial [Acidobacteriota bacterium]|nr:hypothetical protein [Acidobacteriota bacterium]